jgi:N4-(beta-N-acetylglucosaminyl)-L-asparaginase
MTPTEACLAVARRIAELCTKEKRNRDDQGRPNFDVKVYALRNDGAHGAAALYANARYAVCDTTGDGPRLEPAAYLFEGRPAGW